MDIWLFLMLLWMLVYRYLFCNFKYEEVSTVITVSLKIDTGDPKGTSLVAGPVGQAGRGYLWGPATVTACQR